MNGEATEEDTATVQHAEMYKVTGLGFAKYLVSAPRSYKREACVAVKQDAAGVIMRYFPDEADLYARRGWTLPTSISRVYDSSAFERDLGFRFQTDFNAILSALRSGEELPFAHDAGYPSPSVEGANLIWPGQA